MKADLVISTKLDDDIAQIKRSRGLSARQLAARDFAREVEDGRANYGAMLSRVWKEAQRAMEAIEGDVDMPAKARVAALKDLAKLMPTLAKAEATHVARIGGVAVEDMSDRQLEREMMAIRRKRKKS